MRTQVPSIYPSVPLNNFDILVKVLLPAFFIRPTSADVNSLIRHVRPISSDCSLRQFKCKNGKCVQQAWMCDGLDDCGDRSDEIDPKCTNLYACGKDEFTCLSGVCIPLEYHCDRERDCPDGSDEGSDACGAVLKCDKDQFECQPGFCISKSWVCDGKPDCYDGKDEKGCNITCANNEFTCANGKCIHHSWVCDMEDDCDDGSDEKNCKPRQCSETDFQCKNKSCISKKWVCDGDFDCPDHSDEENCPTNKDMYSMCASDEFSCPDKIHCVKRSVLCNGKQDCPDGGDEAPEVCYNVSCRADQFQCHNYQCIEGHKQCDGQKDCSDGSDEEDCASITHCTKDQFNCGGGICIPLSKVCDRRRDCPLGEDEPKRKCGVNECQINNGGCSDVCVDTAIGYYCDCHSGYKLSGNSTCVDINECDNPGTCSQICVNHRGSYSCECVDGYIVDPLNPSHCVANSSHEATLIFSRRNDIRQVSLDGKNMSVIVSNTTTSAALDFLFQTKMIFWSDLNEKKIYKAPIYAGHIRSVVISNVSTCEGIAVDWIYNHIYWTDTGKKSIEVSDSEGTMKKTLISENLSEPRAIVVNPLDGWMYWSDWGYEGRIERAGLDGSNRRRMVSNGVKWPNGLTLDLVRNRLYWVDAKTNSISSVNLDGSGRTLILKNAESLVHPYSISAFEDYVYWTDWDKQTIFKANKFSGTNLSTIVDTRMLQNPMVVQVYHPYRQPDAANHCVRMNCSHLCLPVPSVNSFMPEVICACPDGLMLHTDGLTCFDKLKPSITPYSEETTPAAEVPVVIDNDRAVYVGVPLYIILGTVSLLLAIPICCLLFYRYYSNKSVNRITFECPAYMKPDDIFRQEKKTLDKHFICSFGEEAQEPLRRPGTNDFI